MGAKREEYVPDPNRFDLRTHFWNNSGELMRTNLYTCHVVNGNSYFERPISSGNLWFENNQPAGRVTYENGVKKIDEHAPHIFYSAPLEGAEALHFELENEKNKNADMLRELEAIKAELAKRAAPADVVREPEPEAKVPDAAPTLTPKGHKAKTD